MKVSKGFTLIELMIVVTVIGILAMIAYPNYSEFVNRGKRAEVKAALMEGAQALERYYSSNGTYLKGDSLADVFSLRVPTSSGTTNYNIEGEGSATSFMLQATRANGMVNDPCGDFRITHTGARTVVDGTRTAAECW